jgi:hypothetical protein
MKSTYAQRVNMTLWPPYCRPASDIISYPRLHIKICNYYDVFLMFPSAWYVSQVKYTENTHSTFNEVQVHVMQMYKCRYLFQRVNTLHD